MSVANANAFALLDDEGTVDAGMLAAKIVVPKKDAPSKSEDASKPGDRNGAKGGRGGSGGASATKGRSGVRSAPRDSGEQGTFDVDASGDKGGRSARGGGRARGKGRGAGGDRAGKREFDRHDASGRGHETEKRHGGGRGNWGAEGDESKELAEKLTLGADGEEADGSDAEAAAPEEKQLSLEEYEALMEEKRAGLNVQREASFKVDKAQFQGMKTFEKQEEDVGLSLNKNSKSNQGTNKAGRERERKERDVVVDVGFRVQSAEEAPARGGDRGGRGRGGDRRGGRGGGRSSGGRGGRTSSGGRGRGGNASINVGDTNAFPSL